MWIKDKDFIRGSVPMTKFAARTLIIATLEIKNGDRFLDIGSGTGSISVEAGTHGAIVTAIDKNEEAYKLTVENGEKYGVQIEGIIGEAPKDLPKKSFDKCFVGGSTGNLEEIFIYLEDTLESDGILVGSFITLKNLEIFRNCLKKYNYLDIETTMIQFSEEDNIGLLRGQNPIFIVKGIKR